MHHQVTKKCFFKHFFGARSYLNNRLLSPLSKSPDVALNSFQKLDSAGLTSLSKERSESWTWKWAKETYTHRQLRQLLSSKFVFARLFLPGVWNKVNCSERYCGQAKNFEFFARNFDLSLKLMLRNLDYMKIGALRHLVICHFRTVSWQYVTAWDRIYFTW